jgi:hypothetical protein
MSECFVYIIATIRDGLAVAPVKVGISKSVASRLATISTSSPTPVGLYLTFPLPRRDMAEAVERAFHSVMRKKRLNGEWFDMAPAQAKAVMMLNVGHFLSCAIGLDGDEISETLREFGLGPEATQ